MLCLADAPPARGGDPDPGHPLRLNPAYDSGDHLHPNAAGYRAMARAINLTLLLRGR